MRYSESQANREIDKISDQHAFNRYTIKAALEDDDIAYFFECFFKREADLETGKQVSRRSLEKALIDFNRQISRRGSEARFLAENHLVKQDTRSGQVYYESMGFGD
jgi:hypothetical protein